MNKLQSDEVHKYVKDYFKNLNLTVLSHPIS